MSIEDHASSWAVSLFDALESNAHTHARILVAAGATLVTIGMWIVHLLDSEIFRFLLQTDGIEKLFFGFALAPPFVVAFIIGSFIYPQPVESFKKNKGPMSTYLYRESASRRWKLLIVAAIIAAINFLLMMITSVS
jgi:hypothetical protein